MAIIRRMPINFVSAKEQANAYLEAQEDIYRREGEKEWKKKKSVIHFTDESEEKRNQEAQIEEYVNRMRKREDLNLTLYNPQVKQLSFGEKTEAEIQPDIVELSVEQKKQREKEDRDSLGESSLNRVIEEQPYVSVRRRDERLIGEVQSCVANGKEDGFVFLNGDLYFFNKKEGVPVANFALQLIDVSVLHLENRKVGKLKRYYNFHIYMGYTPQPIFARIPCDRCTNLKKYNEYCLGKAHVYSGQQELFMRYVKTIIGAQVPCVYEYESPGWKIIQNQQNKPYCIYLTPEGVAGNLNAPVRCLDSRKFSGKGTFGVKDFQLFLEMRKIAPDSVTIPLILWDVIALAGQFYKLAGFEVKFCIGLLGETNSRKTSLATAVCQFYGRDQLKPLVSFESTSGGIEEMLSRYADEPLIIDDLRPRDSKTAQQDQNAKLEMVLRFVGDRVRKMRMSVYSEVGGEINLPINAYPVITGETIAGSASTMSRILALNIQRDSVDNERLAFYQKNTNVLEKFVYAFAAYLGANADKIIEFISKSVFSKRSDAQKLYRLPRSGEYHAVLLSASELLMMFAIEMKLLSKDVTDQIYTEFEECILELLRVNDEGYVAKDPGIMAVEALESAVYNEDTCIYRVEPDSNIQASAYENVIVVEMESNRAYIRPEFAYMVCAEYFKKKLQKFPLQTEQELTNYLYSKGVLCCATENGKTRRTVKSKYFTNYKRVLCIDLGMLREVIQNHNLN